MKRRRRAPTGHSAEADAETEGLLTGQLLIAMPALESSEFAQTVIYVCAHTPDGAMGITINRPLARPSFD
ncbi:YqgE/AlgH family protein, partial [Enterococcus faecium]|uniref:YqgE/AlgH family protein n=1 Tax=Enterococcus faecium TaxID=1352 RepID=UPI003F41EA11